MLPTWAFKLFLLHSFPPRKNSRHAGDGGILGNSQGNGTKAITWKSGREEFAHGGVATWDVFRRNSILLRFTQFNLPSLGGNLYTFPKDNTSLNGQFSKPAMWSTTGRRLYLVISPYFSHICLWVKSPGGILTMDPKFRCRRGLVLRRWGGDDW